MGLLVLKAVSGGKTHIADVELIDLDRFLELWQDFYTKLEDEDRAKLPLIPVYFLAPDE